MMAWLGFRFVFKALCVSFREKGIKQRDSIDDLHNTDFNPDWQSLVKAFLFFSEECVRIVDFCIDGLFLKSSRILVHIN